MLGSSVVALCRANRHIIDWVHDAQKDAWRLKALRARKDFRGRLHALFDGAQGWILVAIIGILTACVAFFVDVSENIFFDWKGGYCTSESFYGTN